MLAGREVRIMTTTGGIRARSIYFHIGAVFEHEMWRKSGGHSHGCARMDHKQLRVPVLVDYLVHYLADLGPSERPTGD